MKSIWLATFALCTVAAPSSAHPLAPALLAIEADTDQTFAVRWKVSRLKPRGSEIQPVLPIHCVELSAAVIQVGDTDVTRSWRVDCGERGLVGRTIAVNGLQKSQTDALVHVRLSDGRLARGLVNSREPTFQVPARENAWAVGRGYLRLGVEHLVNGLDHVLFVIGLVLLVSGWRSLVATITAFTLGHSVTLSAAALGFVSVPTRWFELAIALSILILAAELASLETSPSWLRRNPWVMAASFGLLHGFGFAGALTSIGLPADQVPLALVSFNLGIEVGQLLIVSPLVAVGLLAGDRLRRLPAAWARVPAYLIGSLAAYWCLERASELLGLGAGL